MDTSSNNQMQIDPKTNPNIGIFPVEGQGPEDSNNIITSDGHPINNRPEDEQVCPNDKIIQIRFHKVKFYYQKIHTCGY